MQDKTPSHSLNEALRQFFDSYPQLMKQRDIAVAVSGGPDSMAMLHALMEWTAQHNQNLYVLSVDHGLRADAKIEAAMVGTWITSQNIKTMRHVILTWQGDKPEKAIMENARHARYDLMAEYMDGHNIETLFVAHHQDDQAETFLIRLAKGSGLDGLAAMDEMQNYKDQITFARPLLNLPKQELIDYCAAHDIPYAQDPSNENADYLRPRLRQSMAVLAGEGLTPKRLSLTSKRMRRARQALEDIADQGYKDSLLQLNDAGFIFDFDKLKSHPEEIVFRIIQQAIAAMRPDAPYQIRMEKLEELVASLLNAPDKFKPRTLGGAIFALKRDKDTQNQSLYIDREKG